MLTQNLRLCAFFLLAILFYAFFWQEKMGLNVLLFSSVIILTLTFLTRGVAKSKSVWVTGLGTFLTADLVILYNSGVVKFAHVCSMLLFIGFVHQPQIKTIFYAIAGLLSGWAALLKNFLTKLPPIQLIPTWMNRQWVHVKVSLIPLIMFSVFYFIFKFANPRFEALATGILEWIGQRFSTFFMDFSFPQVMFFLTGLLIAAFVVYPKPNSSILKKEQSHSDELLPRPGSMEKALVGLQKEMKMGLLCMGLVNGLLLVINIIDIDWIWLNFTDADTINLSQFVHEGTYLLILSILLSIGIMLFFFRGNQNFSPHNVWLKRMSYLWIVQNIILVISVSLRNYHYIDVHGLAYKRIGVIFFLALTLFGLWTLIRKIQSRKTTFYLLQANSWAVYAVMLVICLVNWDPTIASYNLTHNKKLDTAYLLRLSDKALPVLLEHQEVFSVEKIAKGTQSPEKEILNQKVYRFKVKQEHYSWLSWNLADHRTGIYLANRN